MLNVVENAPTSIPPNPFTVYEPGSRKRELGRMPFEIDPPRKPALAPEKMYVRDLDPLGPVSINGDPKSSGIEGGIIPGRGSAFSMSPGSV